MKNLFRDKVVSALLFIVQILTTTSTVFVPVKAQTEISVINPQTGDNNFIFYTTNSSVGTRFNVTVWVHNVNDLFAYQVKMFYNSTLLNVTRAWLPEWNTSWVFYGKNTVMPTPVIDSVESYVLIGDSIFSGQPTFNGSGKLVVIEFEIVHVPTTQKVFTDLEIENLATYLLNSDLEDISTAKSNGYYEFVSVAGSIITLIVDPTHVMKGSNITISGELQPSKLGVTVTIHYRLLDEAWDILETVITDSNSHYIYTWTTTRIGIYEVKASWTGDAETTGAVSTIKTVIVGIVSNITISVNPTSLEVGSNVTINGTITPTQAYVNVTIFYRKLGLQIWLALATVKTDTDSHYAHVWKTTEEGTFELKASWTGDENTLPAESEIKTIAVYLPSPQPPPWWPPWLPWPPTQPPPPPWWGPGPEPPVASFTYSPTPAIATLTTTFNAESSTPNGGAIIGYFWNFGDDNTTYVSDPLVTQTFATHGTYNVTLTVFDDEGFYDVTWALVTVVTHDISIVDVRPSTDHTYVGRTISVNVTATNEGDVTENFTAILYYNITANDIVGTQEVTSLLPGEYRTLIFLWDTTEVTPCRNYTLTAVASVVQNETDTADNMLVSIVPIKVKLFSDINGDDKIDIKDIALAGLAFGAYPSHPRWNVEADLNNDGKVDIKDLVLVARNFGKTC